MRVGKADVFAGEAHQPSQYIERLFARRQHTRQIIERGLRVGAAQGFVERGNQIVMAVAVLVVNRDAALEEFAQRGGIERVRDLGSVERFGLIEQEASVTVCRGQQRFARFGSEG